MTAVAGCKLRPSPCMNWLQATKRSLFGPQQGRFDPKVVKYSRAKAIRNGSAPMHFLAHALSQRWETCVTSWRDPNTCRGRRLRACTAQNKFKKTLRLCAEPHVLGSSPPSHAMLGSSPPSHATFRSCAPLATSKLRKCGEKAL